MLSPKPLIACVVLFASGAAFCRSSNSENRSASTVANPTVVNSDLMSQNSDTIELIGNWESTAFGHQMLTTRSDGTASISMTLTPFAVPIYGRNVRLELEWTLNGRYLTQHIVGGTPERSVEKLIRRYGDTHEYLLVEHDSNHLLVKDTSRHGDLVRWTAVAHVP